MSQLNSHERMMQTAREWLAGKSPEKIAAYSGVSFDAERAVFTVPSFGKIVEIHDPGYTFSSNIDPWHQMTLLHYFNLADGTPPSGEWISLSQMASGMIRGGGFDRLFETFVRTRLGNFSVQDVEAACCRMGMTLVESNADLCARYDLAPFFPVMMKLWFADPEDDLPASGRVFVDRTADHFLTIEDTVTVCEYLLVEKLKRELGLEGIIV